MTPKDIQTIYELLANRVVPQSAREGAAILSLATKLVQNFAPPTMDAVVHPTKPPHELPDPTPPPPG